MLNKTACSCKKVVHVIELHLILLELTLACGQVDCNIIMINICDPASENQPCKHIKIAYFFNFAVITYNLFL